MRTIALYLDLLVQDIQVRSRYRVDFFIGLAASALQHAVSLGTLWLIFRQVPDLGGWNAAQAAVLYGLFTLTMGLTNLLGTGLRQLPTFVEIGELDGYLVTPVSLYVQMLPRFNPGALGDLLLGMAVLAVGGGPAGVQWSGLTIFFCVLAVLAGTAVLMGILTAVYALAFWVTQPGASSGMEQLMQLARYPSTIYPHWVQVVITWVFPVAFAAFFPAAVLTKVQAMPVWQGLLALPVAAAVAVLGGLMWRAGLAKYESTGS